MIVIEEMAFAEKDVLILNFEAKHYCMQRTYVQNQKIQFQTNMLFSGDFMES